MLITLSVPADNERGPQYMEQVLAAIHQSNPQRLPVEFSFGCHQQAVVLYCRFPPELRAVITTQIAAHYPSATVTLIPDDSLQGTAANRIWSVELRLHPDLFPIRRFAQFDDMVNRNISDPITGILATLAPDAHRLLRSTIVITTRPAKARRVRRASEVLHRLASSFFRSHHTLAYWYASASSSRWTLARFLAAVLAMLADASGRPAGAPSLTTSSGRAHDREENLQAVADKLARHLFETHIRLDVSGVPKDAALAELQLRQMAGAFGQFTVPRMATFRVSRMRRRASRHSIPRRGFLLSCEELATLWHPATTTVRAPAMQMTESRELEPPVVLPTPMNDPGLAVLGRVKFRARREQFGIRTEDRRRHMAVIGKTGMGKTTLLHRLIGSDIRAGNGVALVDPHGDLADAILASIPSHRTNDVVLFDAGDREYPPSYNPLRCPQADQRGLVASGIVSAFKKIYGDSWGPRLEHILRNALLALLETPGASLLSLQKLLTDDFFRKSITDRLADPVVRTFWQCEFAGWKTQYRAEAVAPIQNKLGQFLSLPTVRAIVGQRRAAVDLRSVMDDGQILVVNLSKGRIGEDASSLLGSLIVTGLQLAAMSRADVSEDARRDFHLFVDEFQNFATDSFATILSEARKYRLTLTIANQYLAQMEEATAAAVFGNVGSLLVFQVGAQDAEVLVGQLGGDLQPRDLLNLPRFRAYARLLVDGMPSRPFSVETLPPPPARDRSRAAVVRSTSRHRYARPATQVEAEIAAQLRH